MTESQNSEVESLRQRLAAARESSDVYSERLARQMEQAVMNETRLRAQLAERDAVIAEVERLSNLDVKCPCCTGYSAILDTVTASPSTVLAEHDARVLEEAADELDGVSILWLDRKRIPRDELIGWLRERATELRKGAGQ